MLITNELANGHLSPTYQNLYTAARLVGARANRNKLTSVLEKVKPGSTSRPQQVMLKQIFNF